MVAVRKNISRARGERAPIEEIRYFFYITTDRQLPVAIHTQISDGFQGDRAPGR